LEALLKKEKLERDIPKDPNAFNGVESSQNLVFSNPLDPAYNLMLEHDYHSPANEEEIAKDKNFCQKNPYCPPERRFLVAKSSSEPEEDRGNL